MSRDKQSHASGRSLWFLGKTIVRRRLRPQRFLASVTAVVVAPWAGCVTDSACQPCPDAIANPCAVDCLPESTSQTPPGAALVNARRCAEPLPRDAVPAPPGTYLAAWRDAHVAGGQQQHWVLSRNLWFAGEDRLAPDALLRLDRIAQTDPENMPWIVIETEPVRIDREQTYGDALRENAELQTRRRQTVINAMVARGVSQAAEKVVFAEDRNVGVRGVEAPQTFNRQFQSVGGRGRGRGGFGGGGGGLGGGGGGFGGFGGGGGGGFGGFGGGGGGFGGGGFF